MERSLLPRACDWCPRSCGANRAAGERGVCGADDTLRIARAALHFWEEPPISGEAGSGTVFFSQCPLRCVYCQNASIASGDVGRAIGIGRLSEICLELAEKGALNINFITPTHYRVHAVEAVRRARAKGLALPIVWNTSGYETLSAVDSLADTVDVYLTDFKYADPQRAARYSHAPDYPETALEALEAMVAQTGPLRFETICDDVDPECEPVARLTRGVVVRHLLLPGGLEDAKRVVRTVHERFGSDVALSLMNQYTPVIDPCSPSARRMPELLERTRDDDYERLLDFADGIGVEDYFWQDGPAAEESFIPAFDYEGV